MKKQLMMAGIIAILLSVGFSGCEESSENGDNDEPGFYTYENTEKGISIEYPDTWNKYENPQQVPGVLVLFSSPSTEPTKVGSLMISVLDLEGHMGMDWFKQAHIENLSIQPTYSDFNVIYEDSAVLSDLPAYKIIFTFTQEGYTWRQLEIWTIKNNTLYFLMHQSDQAYYDTFTDIIDQMIESFEIIDTSEQNGGGGGNDFDKFIGAWGEGETVSITFFSDGTYSSGGDGTFELSDGKLVLTDLGDTFEYSFSDDDNTLALTNIDTGVVTVLTKQE